VGSVAVALEAALVALLDHRLPTRPAAMQMQEVMRVPVLGEVRSVLGHLAVEAAAHQAPRPLRRLLRAAPRRPLPPLGRGAHPSERDRHPSRHGRPRRSSTPTDLPTRTSGEVHPSGEAPPPQDPAAMAASAAATTTLHPLVLVGREAQRRPRAPCPPRLAPSLWTAWREPMRTIGRGSKVLARLTLCTWTCLGQMPEAAVRTHFCATYCSGPNRPVTRRRS